MKIRFCILIWILLGAGIASGQQSELEITGHVFRAGDKSPVMGAVVSAANSVRSVVTDSAGYFKLSLKSATYMITVKYSDYHTEEIYLHGKQQVNVYMIPVAEPGYSKELRLPFRVKKMADKVGTSVTLYAQDMERSKMYADELLSGTIAGVRTVNMGGMPGEGNLVMLRGIRSLSGQNTPLIVIDGVPVIADQTPSSVFNGYSRNIFKEVSMKEIGDITVVKGMDAMAYGSIGSNGVIMINTDRAEDMDTRVEFETVNGVTATARKLSLLDANGFKKYLYRIGLEKYNGNDLYNVFPFLRENPAFGIDYYAYQHNTDWQNEIFSPAFTTENILKVKGGDAIAKYALNAGFSKVNGMEDNTGQARYFARFNADVKMSQKLAMATYIGFNYYESSLFEQGMVPEINPMLAALRKPAVLGLYQVTATGKELGVWDKIRQFGVSNPAALVNELEGTNSLYDIKINLNMAYSFTPELVLKGTLGVDYEHNREKLFIPGVSSESIMPLEGGKAENTVRHGMGRKLSYYGTLGLAYTHTFRNGDVLTANAGGQYIWNNRFFEYGKGINTATDYNKLLNNTTDGSGRSLGTYNEKWKWGNFYGNVNYEYRHQLYLGVALSADAASVTGDNANLFNFYPAVNGAWKLNHSSFMRDIEFVSDLTLRGEFSIKGNSMLPPMIAKYYYEGNGYRQVGGLVRANIPNDKLEQEKVYTTDLGLDFATLGNKLRFSLDVYKEQTREMIVPEDLAAAFGSKFRYCNAGEMETKGIEAGIQAIALRRGKFEWRLGATISHYVSQITDLGGVDQRVAVLEDGAAIVSKVGASPYAFYGLEAKGVYATTAEATAAALKDYRGICYRAGDMRYTDRNDDGVINDKDRVVIGDPTPDFAGGFTTIFRYANISLSARFTYSYGNDVYNAVRCVGESMKDFSSQTSAVLNSWYYEGQSTDMPKAEYGDPMNNSQFSSRWIEDGSYLKLNNVTLNYEYPYPWLFFKKLQFYVAADNLFTVTKYLGYDPECAYSYDYKMAGVDFGKVPVGRTFKIGIRLGF